MLGSAWARQNEGKKDTLVDAGGESEMQQVVRRIKGTGVVGRDCEEDGQYFVVGGPKRLSRTGGDVSLHQEWQMKGDGEEDESGDSSTARKHVKRSPLNSIGCRGVSDRRVRSRWASRGVRWPAGRSRWEEWRRVEERAERLGKIRDEVLRVRWGIVEWLRVSASNFEVSGEADEGEIPGGEGL
jgi:hypothetical protein